MIIGLTLAKNEISIIKDFFIKSDAFTINTIIDKFRTGEIPTPEIGKHKFSKGEKTLIFGASDENAAFIDTIVVASKSYTVRCLITAFGAHRTPPNID